MSWAVKEIELKKIQPCRLNPRLDFNIERLNELANSIREVGLLEPIIVRPANGEYEVVVGERRYRAAHQAGLEKLPAIVREYSDFEVMQLNLVENVQREELSAIEKGKVCKRLLTEFSEKYPDQKALAKKIGVSSDAVSLWLRAVEIVAQQAQKYVAPSMASGRMPEGKIDYLTAMKVGRSVKEPERQTELIKKLAEKHLPVKERTQVLARIAHEPEKPVDEVIEEVTEAPCDLTFVAADKKLILDGVKTQTTRTNIPDPKVKAGAIVHAVIWEPCFADLRITSVERKRLKYFDDEDAKMEGYRTLEEFHETWKDLYGKWDEEQLVYVIHFEKAEATGKNSPTNL